MEGRLRRDGPQYVAAPIAPVLPPWEHRVNIRVARRRGRAMSTVQRDRLAIMLRLLLAVGLATSLGYCSTAIEQAKALFTCVQAPSAASTSQSPGCGHFSSERGPTRLDQRRDQGLRAGVGAFGL